MIKFIKVILLIFLFAIVINCRLKNNADTVGEIITRYHLQNYPYGNKDITIETSFLITRKLYINKTYDKYLLVLINKKGDTILSHLGKGVAEIFCSKIFKQKGAYLLEKRSFGKTNYDSVGKILNFLDDYHIDYPMNNYYMVDTINKDLKKIDLVSKPELIERNKGKFNFSVTNVIALTNRFIYLAKDTLKNYQIYYQIKTKYELEKRDNTFVLFPNLSPNSEDILKIGLYKNNQNISIQHLGNTQTLISQDSIGHNVNKYTVLLRFYSRFLCDSINYQYCQDRFEKLDVMLYQRGKKEQKVIKTFTNDYFFKDERFNMFKYKNGDYFLGVLPAIDKEYKFSLFRLDTINWKMEQVRKFDRKKDLVFERYENGKSSLISGDTSGEMSTFLDEYEIVKVGNGFKLIDGYIKPTLNRN